MRLSIVFFVLILSEFLFAQNHSEIKINFIPSFNHQKIVFDSTYYLMPSGDSVAFTNLKFYISDILFYKSDSLIYRQENSYHLMDASIDNGLAITLPRPNLSSFDAIHFNLGIDSTTNVSGALGGDLDPTKGMYWTWQSGYINLRLEGKSNICKTRNNEFGFHLGGYLTPSYAMQKVVLHAENPTEINIEIALDKFLEQIDLSKQNMIMIPGKEAVIVSQKMAQSFSIATQ